MKSLVLGTAFFMVPGDVSLRTQNTMVYFGKEIKGCLLNKHTALSYFKISKQYLHFPSLVKLLKNISSHQVNKRSECSLTL